MTEYENEDLDISFDFESMDDTKKYPWYKSIKECNKKEIKEC